MSAESNRTYAWVGVVVDLLLILVGLVMIAQGWWTAFAEIVVAIGSFGLIVSLVQLWRTRRSAAHGPQ
ncbi:MAG TPA: hypothetical protein VFL59_06800 [Candidatus Nanopelagicales bacterium]|nr:hypothetical protein [Candidatus Nanopelagicales bacterium]